MILPPLFENIPDELKALPQWVLWRKGKRKPTDEKETKIPYQVSGEKADSTAPATWSSFEAVETAYRKGGFDGVGYVFSSSDPYAGLDLDACRNPETGAVEEWALDYVRRLNSYTEISPTGTGLKVIVRAKKRGARCSTGKGPKREFYDANRFFTLTGHLFTEEVPTCG